VCNSSDTYDVDFDTVLPLWKVKKKCQKKLDWYPVRLTNIPVAYLVNENVVLQVGFDSRNGYNYKYVSSTKIPRSTNAGTAGRWVFKAINNPGNYIDILHVYIICDCALLKW